MKSRSIRIPKLSNYASDDVTIVTTHYNFAQFDRTRQTYYEWLPKLPAGIASRVICYEAVLDEDEPEIQGATVLRGSRAENMLWQKEAMLQVALERCETPVLCWIDHDIYYSPDDWDWLSRGLALLSDTNRAVQLFENCNHYAKNGDLFAKRNMFVGGWSPGGVWLAETNFVRDIGGFPKTMIAGSGDLDLYNRMKSRATYLDLTAHHLWHGDLSNRRYIKRHEMLAELGFDEKTDIGSAENGLACWKSDKPELRQAVRDYFTNRREDG